MTAHHDNGAARPPSRGGIPDIGRLAPRPSGGEVVVRPAGQPPAVSSLQPGIGHILVPRMGLRLPHQLTFEDWLGVGLKLSAVAASSAWCLGDWLAYGQQAYSGRYRQAVERTGLDYQTLRNYAWVARRFELSRRRDTLSFGHHAEVASLPGPEQDFWLRKVEQFGWSTSQLRREVRASIQERQDTQPKIEPGDDPAETQPGQPSDRPVTIRIRLTGEQAHRCGQAATKHGLTVPAWAAHVLDHFSQPQRPHGERPGQG